MAFAKVLVTSCIETSIVIPYDHVCLTDLFCDFGLSENGLSG